MRKYNSFFGSYTGLRFLSAALLCLLALIPMAGVAQNQVVGFTLIDADTDLPVQGFNPIASGSTLNLFSLPTNLNVRVNVASEEGATKSVVMSLTGPTVREQTESGAPYALFGDVGGDYESFPFNLGTHQLSATPYSLDGGLGSEGTGLSIVFFVINESTGAPHVELTIPSNGTADTAPALFELTAEAYDLEGSVTQVEFFEGNNSIGVDTTEPYSINWNGVPLGEYSLTAVATDNDSNTATSSISNVRVVTPGPPGTVSGELKKWHKVTIVFDGPSVSETDVVNPFLDYRLDVTFSGPDGRQYVVPGYYAADGDAANTGASSGNKWCVHFAPGQVGVWTYVATFVTGTNVAADSTSVGTPTAFDRASGTLSIGSTDKVGRDFRAHGRLEYVGGHYLRFAESGKYFLKQGSDSPENIFAYAEFDGPLKTDGTADELIKTWGPHIADWNSATDPSWSQVDGSTGGSYGRGIIGALNYLASEGLNAFSFIPFSVEGDDGNVTPYLDYDERERFDVSRLAQWEIVLEHATQLGLFIHFKTQETENEQLLDGGDVGVQRRLYYRELIARFGHHLALNWNLGEESDAPLAQKVAWADFFDQNDPYHHHLVIHNEPGNPSATQYELVGAASKLTGLSLQTLLPDFSLVHDQVLDYLARSKSSGKPWAVACDEPGDAEFAIRHDDDAEDSHTDGRRNALWGTLLAGGWGNEWYFGYANLQSDLNLQDFRTRDQWWDYPRYALRFFEITGVPFWEMTNDNSLSSASDDYCFYKDGEHYLVYLKTGGSTNLDLSAHSGSFSVQWYDPRNGGELQTGTVSSITAGSSVSIGSPPNNTGQDWLALVQADSAGDVMPPRLLSLSANDTTFEPGGLSIVLTLEFSEAITGLSADDNVVTTSNEGDASTLSKFLISSDPLLSLVVIGVSEDFFVDVRSQAALNVFLSEAGVTDLAGNALLYSPESLALTIEPTEMQSWLMGYGVTEWDPDVDTDSDGFTLLQEYFHLQSPIADDNYTFYTKIVEIDGDEYFTITLPCLNQLSFSYPPGGGELIDSYSGYYEVWQTSVGLGLPFGSNPGLVLLEPALDEGLPALPFTHQYRTLQVASPQSENPNVFIRRQTTVE